MRLALILITIAAPAAARTTALDPDSALHGYVLGRYAALDNQLEQAARYYDLARAQDPARAALTQRAFHLAMASGDKDRAFALSRQLSAAGAVDSDTSMVAMADAVLRRDWAGVDKARAGIASAGYAAVVGPIVNAWALFGRGKHAEALAKLDPALFSGFARSYIAEQRAHMLAADGQWVAAATAYADLGGAAGAGVSFLRLGEADALAQSGNRQAALARLAGDDPGMVAARNRLMAGKRIGALAPDPRRGIGWMSARLATDLSRDQPVPLALLFARVATFLAPDMPATWVVCGDVLARNGLRTAALVSYAEIAPGDPLAGLAKVRRAESLESLGRGADAGALLLAAANARGADVGDWTRLGDWHRRADRYTAAIAAYARAIALAGNDAPWALYFLRGSSAERAGDWSAAQNDLREALKRSPDEPVVLNYLGYSMLDRGKGSEEAVEMIAKAAKLRPGDGGIIDSLGWSQYHTGRYTDAVTTLEQAVALEPTDPTVADHLGDAYWRASRRIEARFRWRAAIDLDPDAKLKSVLQAKLDYGLDAALAMVK